MSLGSLTKIIQIEYCPADPIQEFNSTDKAAQVFLMEVTAKRKDTLMAILNFCNQYDVLTTLA